MPSDHQPLQRGQDEPGLRLHRQVGAKLTLRNSSSQKPLETLFRPLKLLADRPAQTRQVMAQDPALDEYPAGICLFLHMGADHFNG